MDLDIASGTQDLSILRKRKWSPSNAVAESIPGLSHYDQPSENASKIKTSADVEVESDHKRPRRPSNTKVEQETFPRQESLANVPPEILQYIFSFVNPIALGCLIRVSRLFQSLLDPSKPLPESTKNLENFSLHPQDSIWSRARKIWIHGMPRPMEGMNEYNTIKLILGKKCQFCGVPPSDSTPSSSPWAQGPGSNSVRIIWPFMIRSCTECLQSRIKTDTEVLLSPSSPLIPGLPFAIFTSSFDLVPPSLLRRHGVPFGVTLTKFFYRPQIEILQAEARESQSLGSGAAEEWFKGLAPRIEKHLAEAARFEQWEANGNLSVTHLQFVTLSQSQQNHSDIQLDQKPNISSVVSEKAPEAFRHLSPPSSAILARKKSPSTLSFSQLPHMPLYPIGLAPGQDAAHNVLVASSDSASQGSQLGFRIQKPSKSARELAKLKAERRQEIERRCQGLDPPIYPDMLEHLDAFLAAIQIPMPLNENAWETLKSRLLAQRRGLELNEESKNAIVVAPIPGQYEAQEQTDEYWLNHSRKPVREKLCEYAEEYIRHVWGAGSFVNYPNAPQFAADVLLHVRARFYEVQNLEDAAKARCRHDDILQLASNSEIRFLRLEEMKWVFEQNVQSRTIQIRKDLFLCNECNIGGNRYFGFDSVIQHYASKHTDELSQGQAVVSWKANWPARPIFNPHPERASTVAPSVSHTPTIYHVPASVFSQSSIHTAQISSAGRQSPGTVSQLSNHTGLFAGQATHPPWSQALNTAPRVGIYHVQRDELADDASRVWEDLVSWPELPPSLRAYVVIHHVIQAFSRKYTNEPPLSMLSDCVRTKPELRPLRSLLDLHCRACALTASNSNEPHLVNRSFSMEELLDHFQKLHLETNRLSKKLDWKLDMIKLPSTSIIRGCIENAVGHDNVKILLNHALVTAISDGDIAVQQDHHDTHKIAAARAGSATQELPAEYPVEQYDTNRAIQYRPHPTSENRAYQSEMELEMQPRSHIFHPPDAGEENGPVLSYRDARGSGTTYWPTARNEVLRADYGQPPARASSQQDVFAPRARQRAPQSMLRDGRSDLAAASPQGSVSMTRSETMRSRAASLRGSQRANSSRTSNAAEKFLDNFEALAEGAIDQPGPRAESSTRTSRPQSMNGSQHGVSQTRRQDIHDSAMSDTWRPKGPFEIQEPAIRGHVRPSSPQYPQTILRSYDRPPSPRETSIHPRERGPVSGYFVEYDRDRSPVEVRDRWHRELPPRDYARPRYYIDEFGRRVDLSPPAYEYVRYREYVPERPRYFDENGRPVDPILTRGPAIEYDRRHPLPHPQQEPLYDPSTDRYYIERPAVREFTDDRYAERVSPTVYRELPVQQDTRQDERMYSRYSPDPYDGRYNEGP